MNIDPESNKPVFSPSGIRLRKKKFGTNMGAPLVPVPANVADSLATRPAFELHLENPGIRLTVHMREREDGHLIVDAFCADPDLVNKAWAAVSLYGKGEWLRISKSIFLDVAEPTGCRGYADFGTMANALKELGHQMGLIAFLMLL